MGSLSCVGLMVISHVKSHGSAARVGLENALVLTVNIHEGKLEIQSSWACVCSFGIAFVPGNQCGTNVQVVCTQTHPK